MQSEITQNSSLKQKIEEKIENRGSTVIIKNLNAYKKLQ